MSDAVRPWLVALGLVAAAGCGPLKRVRECQRVIETVNTSLRELQPQLNQAAAQPAAYVNISAAYAELEKRLTAIPVQDPALRDAVASYRDLAARAARKSRLYSEELDKPADSPEENQEKDTRLGRLRNQAKSDVAREATIVRRLNTLCHPQ